MVEPIGTRTTRAVTRTSAAAGTSTVVDGGTKTAAAPGDALGAVGRDLAGSAPVDSDRVAEIKAAIAKGTFPILPAKIADRLIAFKLQWDPSDAS